MWALSDAIAANAEEFAIIETLDAGKPITDDAALDLIKQTIRYDSSWTGDSKTEGHCTGLVEKALNQSGYNTGNEGDPAISVIGVDATDAAIEAIKAGKMTATVKQDGDAMGEANIRFMMNYLLNGSFYEGLEDKYKLNDDGVSVYIPYAKITEENAE